MSREYDEDIREAAEAIGMGFNDSAIKAAWDLGLIDDEIVLPSDVENDDDDQYISDEELAKLEEEDYYEAVNYRYCY